MTPKIGDWVRFQRGGQLVIGSVAYIVPRSQYDSTPTAMTVEHGLIDFSSIIEIRREAADAERHSA